MIAVHARYRGREKGRAQLVKRSAEALSTLPGVGEFEIVGVEDIRAHVDSPDDALNLIMALLSDGNWAIGLGITQRGSAAASATEATGVKPAAVGVIVDTVDPADAERLPPTSPPCSRSSATSCTSAPTRAAKPRRWCAAG